MTAPHLFDASAAALALGLRGVTFIVEDLTNREHDPVFQLELEARLAELRAAWTPETLRGDATLQGFRDLHTRVGFSNRNYPPSAETLLLNLLKTGGLRSVNLLVDLYNLVSLETHLALGAHDLAHVQGNIHLRPMSGAETVWMLGTPAPKPARPGGYAYIDDADEVLCMLDARQVQKSKITTATTAAFFIVQGHAAVAPQRIQSAANRLQDLILRLCGGRVTQVTPFGME